MHITLAAVISLDGKITRGDESDVHAWASDEDWRHFVALRDKHDALIMDRLSYETVRPQPVPGLLRIVLTSRPARYASQTVPEQLEFMTASAEEAVAVLAGRGRERILLAGGSTVSRDFFAAGLVDEVYITVEPYVFGAGTPFVAPDLLDVRLHLDAVRQLNEAGTLLLHYRVAH